MSGKECSLDDYKTDLPTVVIITRVAKVSVRRIHDEKSADERLADVGACA